MFQGGIAGTVADPKLIFGCALKAAAGGIILTHNHPSGFLRPSQTDIILTKKLKEGGRLFRYSRVRSYYHYQRKIFFIR